MYNIYVWVGVCVCKYIYIYSALLNKGDAVDVAAVVVNQRRIYYLVVTHDWQETLTGERALRVIFMYIDIYDAYLY